MLFILLSIAKLLIHILFTNKNKRAITLLETFPGIIFICITKENKNKQRKQTRPKYNGWQWSNVRTRPPQTHQSEEFKISNALL